MLYNLVVSIGGKFIEISSKRVIRNLMRVFKRKYLSWITKRVEVRIPKAEHRARERDETSIEFVAYVDNQAPLDIFVKGGEVIVYNHDFRIAEIRVPSTKIEKNKINKRITIATYHPFLYPVGIPVKNDNWALRVKLEFNCYFGEWATDTLYSDPFKVEIPSEKAWESLRNLVNRNPDLYGGK